MKPIHRRFAIAVTAAAAAATMAVSPALRAQETAESREAAREHYSKGKQLYEASEFAEAMDEFQAAYDAKPHPTVLKSIAECKVQIGDVSGAIAVFEKYLSDPGAPKRAEVEKRLAEVKAMMCSLEIETEPPGAGVMIDGAVTEEVTPASIAIAPGDHEIALNMNGFEPLVKQVALSPGEAGKVTANFATEGVPIQLSEPTLVDPFADEEGGEGEEAAEGGEVEEDEGPPAAFWACAAITGVGLVAGTVFGTMALSDEEEFEDTGRTDTSIQETGERNALIADISFIVAAASAVVGIVVLATDKDDEEPVEEPVEEAKSSLEVYPVAGADTVGVGATVTF